MKIDLTTGVIARLSSFVEVLQYLPSRRIIQLMRKRSLAVLVVTILALAIAVFASGQLSAPKPEPASVEFSDGDLVSLSGELVCLPHRDQSGPQTMECAYGFRDESGTYYAVEDGTEGYSLIGNMPMNEPLQIEGTYKSNSDTKYQQNGTIEATSIAR